MKTHWALFTLLGYAALAMAAGDGSARLTLTDDHGLQVRAEIQVFAGSEQPSWSGTTDEQGVVTFNPEPGQTLRIHPVDTGRYYACSLVWGPGPRQVTLLDKTLAANLEANADMFVEQGAFAKAALVLNELCARFGSIDAEKAKDYEIRTYQALANHFEIVHATYFDPLQDQVVMSAVLADKVRHAQEALELPPTGRVDYRFLSKVAGEQVHRFLFWRQAP